MVSKLKQLIRERTAGKENGNTLIVWMLLFPVIFSAFGLAVDTTIATFTSGGLQSNLDAATQSALSGARNPGTGDGVYRKPSLTPEQARTRILAVYETNRIGLGEQPFINCQTSVTEPSSGAVPGARLIIPSSGCGFTQTSYRMDINNGQISTQIRILEKSNTVFLGLLGIREFKYDIESSSRITYQQN
jgi:hypothetical protein